MWWLAVFFRAVGYFGSQTMENDIACIIDSESGNGQRYVLSFGTAIVCMLPSPLM